MTDSYLVSILSEQDPWIANVYEQTSGYIHLSRRHILNSLTAVGEDGRFAMKMSSEDGVVPANAYLEAIEALRAASGVFLRYLESWSLTKSSRTLKEGE